MKTNFILFIIVFFYTTVTFGQENIKKDVLAAAEKGYVAYLEMIPAGKEPLYGFNNRDEFAKVKLGKPYQFMTLSKDFFTDPTLKNKDYIIPSGNWRVPLIVGNENRALLTVSDFEGSWKVVGLGATSLARELGVFEKEHPSKNRYGKILRIYQNVSDYVLLPSNDDSEAMDLIPLKSAKNALAENGQSFSSIKLNKALPMIKENIKNQ
jgi:hypothetical protein